jgi:hypothetical protein
LTALLGRPLAALAALAAPFVLLAGGSARADHQLWLEAGFELQPTSRLELQLAPQIRLDQDVSRFLAFLPELSLRYRAATWLRVGGGYRFEYERNNDGELVVRHRVSADARLRLQLDPMRVDYRLMLVEQYRPSSNDQYRTLLRNRVELRLGAWQRWTPSIAGETFHALGDLDTVVYDRLRLTAGVAHDRGDHELTMFIRVELHADATDDTDYILGLGYSFEP